MNTPIDIKALRLRLGLTQVELAHRLGVAEFTVRRWEKGKFKPSRHLHEKIRRQLNLSSDKEVRK